VQLIPVRRILFQGEQPVAVVGSTGDFTIPKVFPGTFRLRITGLSSDLVVAAATLGTRDAFFSQFQIASAADELQITLRHHGAVVPGTVVDGNDNNPVSGAVVVLVPEPASDSQIPAQLTVLRCDQSGHFTSAALTPGRYFIFSTPPSNDGDEQSPESLRSHLRWSAPFDLRPGEAQELKLKIGAP
jgi:hypothetical protein